jgi:hypothetical protein
MNEVSKKDIYVLRERHENYKNISCFNDIIQ